MLNDEKGRERRDGPLPAFLSDATNFLFGRRLPNAATASLGDGRYPRTDRHVRTIRDYRESTSNKNSDELAYHRCSQTSHSQPIISLKTSRDRLFSVSQVAFPRLYASKRNRFSFIARTMRSNQGRLPSVVAQPKSPVSPAMSV